MNGWTFPYANRDVFVVTDKKRKTKKLASQILRKMLLPDSPARRDELLWYLQKATIEATDKYIEVKGKNFTFVDPERNTEIIYL